VLFALMGLCLGAIVLAVVSNQGLPERSPQPERLSAAEKARLGEADHLRRSLGDSVWPGWGQVAVPFVVYNEEYAFAVGLPDPAPGWNFVLGRKLGAAWEGAAGDALAGQPYFRQRLATPDENPQNFIAQIGETWVATMQTVEYSEIAFYLGFRETLPPGVREVLPYRLLWSVLGGGMDGSVAGLAHEAFHVFQANRSVGRVQAAERVSRLENSYPFDDVRQNEAWKAELDLLVQAVRAPSTADARVLAQRWAVARQARRAGLSSELVDYERQREWLEGLAKYAELTLAKAAGDPAYQPTPEILAVPNFKRYADRAYFWEMQLDEVKRMDTYRSETRFYYSGFAQAALLDRLSPGWKVNIFQDGVFLEDLLNG